MAGSRLCLRPPPAGSARSGICAATAIRSRIRGSCAGSHRVAGCATPTSFADHAPAGPTTGAELTFYPDHSVGAGHLPIVHQSNVIESSAPRPHCGDTSSTKGRVPTFHIIGLENTPRPDATDLLLAVRRPNSTTA